jgi:hypothetical protein
MDILKATSIEQVHQAFANKSLTLAVTEFTTADNRRGFYRNTMVSASCDGPDGYLGTIVIAPAIDPGIYIQNNITFKNWTVVRYQVNAFQWIPNDPQSPYAVSTPVAEADPGYFFSSIGIVWTPKSLVSAEAEVLAFDESRSMS